jgi:hypothetical protein
LNGFLGSPQTHTWDARPQITISSWSGLVVKMEFVTEGLPDHQLFWALFYDHYAENRYGQQNTVTCYVFTGGYVFLAKLPVLFYIFNSTAVLNKYS